jgi:hypothetical protein
MAGLTFFQIPMGHFFAHPGGAAVLCNIIVKNPAAISAIRISANHWHPIPA